MSNKSSKQLPENLRGKVIVVSATLPGAGKSYVRKFWARQLRTQHYQVWNLGTTNKCSDDNTVTKQFGTFVKNKKTFTYKSPCTKKGGVHKTRAFVLVDEAFMLQKGHLIDLVKYYPECCFILFGDPLQFDPVTTYVLEGDNEELLLQQAAYNESVGIMIDKADLVIDIQGSHRYEKNSELFKVIQEIRRGVIDTKLVWDFIQERVTNEVDYSEPHIIIPFTKAASETYNFESMSVGGYELYRAIDSRFVSDGKKLWAKGDIFEHTTSVWGEDYYRNIETGTYLDLPDEPGLFDPNHKNCSFERANAVNAHKVQGATIGNQTIYIPLYDILKYIGPKKDERWGWLQKYLYVTLSRARSADQIKFLVDACPEAVVQTLNNCLDTGFDPMQNMLLKDAITVADSQDLIMDDVESYLRILVDETNVYKEDVAFDILVKRADFGRICPSRGRVQIDLSFVIDELQKAGFTKDSKGIQKYLMENKICGTASYQKHKDEILAKL